MPDEQERTGQESRPEEGQPQAIDFAAWLATQSEETQAAYEKHVAGLKSALQTEREQRKEHERTKRETERVREEQEAQKLAEQQKWEELAARREREMAGLKAEIEQERMTTLRLRVAQAKGLPSELVGRLQGATEEELNADADALLKLIKSNAPKDTIPATPRSDDGIPREDKRKQAWYARL